MRNRFTVIITQHSFSNAGMEYSYLNKKLVFIRCGSMQFQVNHAQDKYSSSIYMNISTIT